MVPGPIFVCHEFCQLNGLKIRQGTFFQSAGLKLKEPLETWLKEQHFRNPSETTIGMEWNGCVHPGLLRMKPPWMIHRNQSLAMDSTMDST